MDGGDSIGDSKEDQNEIQLNSNLTTALRRMNDDTSLNRRHAREIALMAVRALVYLQFEASLEALLCSALPVEPEIIEIDSET